MDASLVPSAAKLGACRRDRRAFVRHCTATCLCACTFRIAAEPVDGEVPESGLRRARREFEALAVATRALDFNRRIAFINVEVNQRIAYAADPESAPGADVWSTPCETLARGTGDCEDFAITKFFLLLASGSPPRRSAAVRALPPAGTPGGAGAAPGGARPVAARRSAGDGLHHPAARVAVMPRRPPTRLQLRPIGRLAADRRGADLARTERDPAVAHDAGAHQAAVALTPDPLGRHSVTSSSAPRISTHSVGVGTVCREQMALMLKRFA